MVGAVGQFLDLIESGRLHPFIVFFCVTWTVFLVRVFLASRHREIEDRPEYDKRLSTSAVVFTYRDPPDLLRQSLRSIQLQDTPFTEVVVAVDAAETEDRLEIVRQSGFVIHVDSSGNKRDAFAGALPLTTGEIVVHLAGDTIYPANMLTKALVAFASDPKIGGVSFEQGIYDDRRSLLRRIANIMYGLRFALTYRALSSRKSLLCTTGETGFFRRAVIEKHMEAFTGEHFRGRRCLIGDDRFLTSMVLREGYSVVLQGGIGQVLTDCPNTYRGFVKQQLRWYRSNQRYSVKTLLGWVEGRPFLKTHLAAFMLLPYLWLAVVAWWMVNSGFKIYPVEALEDIPFIVLLPLIVLGFLLAVFIKTSPHFMRHPRDLWLFPVYVPFVTFVILPTFVYALLTIGDQGSWETKRSDRPPGMKPVGRFNPHLIVLAILLAVPLAVIEMLSPLDATAMGGD